MVFYFRSLPRLECDLNFGLPVLIVLGFIYSFWATDLVLNAIQTIRFFEESDFHFIFDPLKNTYCLLNIYTSIALYYGLKNNDKKLIKYWHYLKLSDCGLCILGAIVFSVSQIDRYWPNCLIALFLVVPGWYLITTLKKGLCLIGLELEPVTFPTIAKNFKRSPLDDSLPPSYKETEKGEENLNLETTKILRAYGFVKLFEVVIVSMGVFVVIINLNNNSWTKLWCVTAIVVCLILCIKFVWTLIPNEKNQTETDNQEENETLLEN